MLPLLQSVIQPFIWFYFGRFFGIWCDIFWLKFLFFFLSFFTHRRRRCRRHCECAHRKCECQDNDSIRIYNLCTKSLLMLVVLLLLLSPRAIFCLHHSSAWTICSGRNRVHNLLFWYEHTNKRRFNVCRTLCLYFNLRSKRSTRVSAVLHKFRAA